MASFKSEESPRSVIAICGDAANPPSSTIGWGTLDKEDAAAMLTKGFAEKVTEAAIKKFDRIVESSSFQSMTKGIHSSDVLSSSGSASLPALRHSQIEVGQLLGHGALSSVFHVVRIETDKDTNGKSSSSDDSLTTSSRSRNTNDQPRTVIKIIKKQAFANAASLSACAADLAKEGEFLAHITHPHILKIKGYSAGGLSNFTSGRNDSFFLLLDELNTTLSKRILHWKSQSAGPRMLLGRRAKNKRDDLFLERLKVAAQLADAVAYLHRNHIIHRDIKPANAGFDKDDVVKLFDMDSCRVLPPNSNINERMFQLTMRVGTLRYVSPECYLGGNYNAKTDSYSFAIMLHEILSMTRPFNKVKQSVIVDRVFNHGLRPSIPHAWPRSIQTLLSRSWSDKIAERMTMEEIYDVLSSEVTKLKARQVSRQSSPHTWWCKRTAPDAVVVSEPSV